MTYFVIILLLLYFLLVLLRIRLINILKNVLEYRKIIFSSLIEIDAIPEFDHRVFSNIYYSEYHFNGKEKQYDNLLDFYKNNHFLPFKLDEKISKGKLIYSYSEEIYKMNFFLMIFIPNLWHLITIFDDIEQWKYELQIYQRDSNFFKFVRNKTECLSFLLSHNIEPIKMDEKHISTYEQFAVK